MGTPRALLRLSLVVLVCLLLFPAALFGRVLHVAGARRSALRAASAVLRLWGHLMLHLIGVRVEVRGLLPRGPVLVCANHLSYLDVPLLAALFGGRFVAKTEIAGWPVIGFLSRTVGTIFVAPRRRAELARTAVELERTLRAGTSVVLFPEGGASRGRELGRFHSALLEGPVREGIPCLPACLHYEPGGGEAGAAWTVCWWGGMELWRHAFRLAALPGVAARVTIGEPVLGADRKELADELRRRIEADFEPVSQVPVPADNPWPHLVEGTASGGE